MGFIDWTKVEPRKGQKGRTAKTVLGEKLTVAIINHEKPSGRGTHQHADMEQVTYILDGTVEFTLGEETRVLQRGDMVVIPAGTLHGVKVIQGQKASCLEIFSSLRPELLS